MTIDKNVKNAIAKHAKADMDVKAAWAELVNAMIPYTDAFIQPHGNGFVQIALPDLDASRKAFIDAVRKECANHYKWNKDKIANNFRQWRYRMAKALAAKKGGELLRNGGGPRKNDGTVILKEEQATALNECLLNITTCRKLTEAKALAEQALAILEAAAGK